MNNWEKSFEIINRLRSVTCSLPNDVFLFLKKECNKVKNKKTRNKTLKLVGHINEEYSINNIPKNLNDFILGKVLREDVIIKRTRELSVISKDVPFYIDKLWVNFQKKHEFNPIHKHNGVFSFVIWLDIALIGITIVQYNSSKIGLVLGIFFIYPIFLYIKWIIRRVKFYLKN